MSSFSIYSEDSYSAEVLDFLKGKLSLSEYAETQILFPCTAIKFNPNFKNILILDHGHFAFESIDLLASKYNWNLILSPRSLSTNVKINHVSLYEEIIKEKTTIQGDSFSKDYIFCSQPLFEDNRDIGFDQYQLENYLKEIFKEEFKGIDLLLRAHPRESRNSDLAGSIYDLLASHDKWIGHSSMVLYGAKSLGHKVFSLNNSDQLDDNLKLKIVQFVNEDKPDVVIQNQRNIKELFII
jgi:hypothetical protein